MSIVRLLLIVYFVNFLLMGCSSENSPSDDNNSSSMQKLGTAKSQLPNQPFNRAGEPVKKPDELRHEPAVPTRSELRVLAEETKATEDKAKNIIGQFDANLGDRDARKEAQAKFKEMLPEYKEKMLQIGKAQLKQEND